MNTQDLNDIYDLCQQNNVNVSFRFHGSKDDIPSFEIKIDDGKYSLIRKTGSWELGKYKVNLKLILLDMLNEFKEKVANNFGEGSGVYIMRRDWIW